MPLPNQIKGQPGEQEIPEIVRAEKPEEGGPCRPLAQNIGNARDTAGVVGGDARPTRHPFEPARQPEQAAQSQGDEERPPAEVRHEDAAHQRAHRRSDFGAGVDQRIRKSALMLVEMRGQDLRITRVSHRLPDPEQQPQRQQHRESMDQAGGGRR